jgi:hypothetical protein
MGFRIDGCGTYDGNKKVKLVGEFKCPKCNKVTPFYIYEMTKKVTVLYIPVAKLSKEFGVMCEKCHTGYKISEQQMINACNGDLRLINSLFAREYAVNNSTTKPGTCPNCKTPIGEGMSFCVNCGTKVR